MIRSLQPPVPSRAKGSAMRAARCGLLAVVVGLVTPADVLPLSAPPPPPAGSGGSVAQVVGFDGETGFEWINRWGTVRADDARLLRLRDVFEALDGQTDVRGRRVPRLVPVGPVGHLDARSLPDGSVVISEEWLEFAYRGVGGDRLADPARLRGDHLLAFIVAHELAHLAQDDEGWLQTVHAVVRASRDGVPADRVSMDSDLRSRERVADRQALFAMLIGGYEPTHVLRPNLFERMESENRRFGVHMVYDVHVPPERRVADLEASLADVAARVPIYDWGVRLLELGRYRDGVRLLEEFQQVFDGPAALANLGYGYYQIAARELAECDGRLVVDRMMPTLIDGDTVARRTRLRGETSSPCLDRPAFRDAIERAQRMLEAAVKRAPYAVAPRLNLIAAYDLDRDRASFAFPHAERLLDLAPDLSEARVAFAMVQHRLAREWGMPDASEAALEVLDDVLGADGEPPPAAFYNRAAILASLGRRAAARESYGDFLELQRTGPWADHARQQVGIEPSPDPAGGPFPDCGLAVGPPDSATEHRLAAMDRIELAWSRTPVDLLEEGPLRVLAIDGVVEVVERRLDSTIGREGLAGIEVPLAAGSMRRGATRALRVGSDGTASVLCFAAVDGI